MTTQAPKLITGTAKQAIDFAIDHIDDHFDRLYFLECWRDGRTASGEDWDDWRQFVKDTAEK